MIAYKIDPLEDSRWAQLSLKHPNASVFHSPAWLRALRIAYEYEPIAVTTTPPGEELKNGIVFCRIPNWLTGDRLVSLPFSDHCEPLVNGRAELDCLLSRLKNDSLLGDVKYIEFRPVTSIVGGQPGIATLAEFRLHKIDLAPSTAILYRRLHQNIQRNIRRAERQLLRYESGTSEKLLEHLRVLLALTRKRHLLPPQPLIWFRSLLDCLGSRITIRIAYRDKTPIAGILTLRHNGIMVYKYGGYDTRYRDCGGMAFLLWRSIQEACHEGLREFDLGRSEPRDAGLIRFKEGWGGTSSTLTYWNYGERRFDSTPSRIMSKFARQLFPYLPDWLIATAGSLLYKHLG